ncbi:cadherin-4 [Crotalus adamanteus]|uniref:Cadherin-4 n=1 Tax=Crotalus adamanteus TaxID=8729 RepID=A0AAW1BSU8_CROAD
MEAGTSLPQAPTCKPGFSEDDYTALVSPNLTERQQFLKVVHYTGSFSAQYFCKHMALMCEKDYRLMAEHLASACRMSHNPAFSYKTIHEEFC